MLKKIIKEKNRFFKKMTMFYHKQKYFYLNKSNRIILFFFPTDSNSISGGLLSITSIQNEIKELEDIHKCKVFCSFLPGVKNNFIKYKTFENDLIVFNFEEITKFLSNLEYLELQIPEIFIPFFEHKNLNFSIFFEWILKIDKIKINVLNQNDTLMPSKEILSNLYEITDDLTMTVAHKNYSTLERRNYYGVPLQLLTPWISVKPYHFNDYKNKKNIIILSPDEIDNKLYNTNINRQTIVNFLKVNLPNYQVITIQNLKYEEYKLLISNAKFAMTFGEGLDGYFAEPIFSGSISFAVYNDVFFPKNFKNLKTVYSTFNILLEKMIDDIKFLDNLENYKNYNSEQLILIDKLYGKHIFKSDIKNYYLENYTFK